jgi:hypothetical protein
VTQSFTIAPKPASVTPNPASKVYGSADPALSGTLSGFLVSDGVSATYSRSAGETVAGSYTISAALGPAVVLGNYTITYNTAAFAITRKLASVTPDATSKTYGAADPTLTGTLAGFLAADGVSATYSRSAGETVAGSYTISATLGPAVVLGNYTITYNTAAFTIVKANQTITFAALGNKAFGDAPFSVLATASSGLPVSFSATGACSVAGVLVTITGPGTCAITASQSGDPNHNAAPSVTRSLIVTCLPAELPFAIRTPRGPIVVAWLVVTSQPPATPPASGCTGGFDVRIPSPVGPVTAARGTFTATAAATTLTTNLTGAFLFGGPAFTATIRFDATTQTGSITTTVPTEDGPVTVLTRFARSGDAYIVTSVSPN